MSVLYWPTSIPQSPQFGMQGGPQDIRASFAPDVGPPIQRRRATKAPHVYGVSLPPMSYAQLATFEAWVEDDLKAGALRFIWRDPISDSPQWWRFTVADPVYGIEAIGPDLVAVSAKMMREPGNPWFANYVMSGSSRSPHVVADYENDIYGVDGQRGAGSDVAAVSGTFDVYTYDAAGALTTTELDHTVNAGDIPASGTGKILAFEVE